MLWIRDLQYWMDEKYIYSCFANTGEVFASSFRVDPPLVPAPCFQPISPASNNHSPAQFFDEATYTKKAKREAMYTFIELFIVGALIEAPPVSMAMGTETITGWRVMTCLPSSTWVLLV